MLLFIARCDCPPQKYGCFNTSHVTLYPPAKLKQHAAWRSFNTSHVTLYLCQGTYSATFEEFQYISCYSLSKVRYGLVVIMLCFNTSHVTLYLVILPASSWMAYRFNTSHVTLYQLESCLDEVIYARFNTSHVTLYPMGKLD